MRQLTTTVYQYSELTDEAKSRAREWYRTLSQDDSFWHESVIEDAQRLGEMLGITFDTRQGSTRDPTIYFSGFWSQGDGACFDGTYQYRAGNVAAIVKEAPQDEELHRIARELAKAQRRYFYRLTATVSRVHGAGNYSHENTRAIDVENGYGNVIAKDDAEALREALRDFMRWIYRRLEAEYEYVNSDEQVAESIECNEHEFNEDGSAA